VLDSVRNLARRTLRSAHGAAVPLADAGALDRAGQRSRLIRLLLAVALVGTVAGAVVLAPGTPERRFLPADSVGIVVLDVSSSVKPQTYYRIEQTLATIAGSRTRLGLVLFSDVAYEALPPGTPSAELKPMLRFFAPATSAAGHSTRAGSPWEQWFSAGTRISSGLYLAANMLQHDHVKRGAVMLISDLADDPTDLKRVVDAVLLLEQRKIPLEIVGLDPSPANADYWRNLLGTEAIFREARLPTAAEAQGKVELTGAFAIGLAVCAVLAVLLLTVNEWWAEPLRWRRRIA
jgi:hypothetical protein